MLRFLDDIFGRTTTQQEAISIVAHQLRTPLTLIEGHLSLLLSDKAGQLDHEAKTYVGQALAQAQRMELLIKDLLTSARLDSGSIQIVPSIFNVSRIVTEVCAELQPKAQQKKIELHLQPVQLCLIKADSSHTREVITNVVDNAIKYTAHGAVTVTLTATATMAVITVTDTGAGIPPEGLESIFDKFQASHDWSEQRTGSHGLGLYITKQLVDAMHGSLTVQSQVGHGTTFTVALALAKPSP